MLKNKIFALFVLLISIIYVGCAGQNKYYIKDNAVDDTSKSVKITLYRKTFSVCDWYAIDDYAYGPTNSIVGVQLASPTPISGMITNSRYGLRFYYLHPDYEDHYGIVDTPWFSLYQVTKRDSDDSTSSEKIMFSSHDLVVSNSTVSTLTYDTNEKGERRAKLPYRILSDFLGDSISKVVTIPVGWFDKNKTETFYFYFRREKTIGRIGNDDKVTWVRKPGLSRIAIVNECPGAGYLPHSPATSHYMASDPIFFKEGYEYEFEYELVTGYKWGEFNMLSEPKKIQDSP